MPLDRSPSDHVAYWGSPEHRARTIVDDQGIEWEVYDEGTWSIQLALDWDMLPQTTNPGLVFVSDVERRRLWPCPDDWKAMADADLLGLLSRAKALT
ncbi:MAG TPA: hypothetical protein VF785_15590 [Gemmatimonadaceae bacterium]